MLCQRVKPQSIFSVLHFEGFVFYKECISVLLFIKIYLFNMPECLCMQHVHAGTPRRPEEGVCSPNLALQVIVRCLVWVTGN